MKPNETFIQDPFAYGDYGNGIGSSLKALSGSALGWLGNKFMGVTTTEQKQRESANGTAQPYPIQNIKEAFEQRPNTIQMIPLPKTNTTQASTVIDKPQNKPIAQTISNNMRPSDLSRFSNGLDMYGKVPGSAIIRDAKTGKVLAKGLGEATGGFARPSTWKENLAFEEEQSRLFWDTVNAGKAREAADLKNNLMSRTNSAIQSGDYKQAAALTTALQAASGIQPLDMSKQGALDIERSQVPYRNKLNEAQAKHYAGLNETTVGGQRLKALADILEAKLKGNKTGALTLDQRIKLEEMKLANPEGYAALAKEYGITG